ncbi:MAG: ATP-binding protein, partial [Desulfobulbaceae bacterium]|nr:ATP-binding protein [Desulfobulbaceae bacterium]
NLAQQIGAYMSRVRAQEALIKKEEDFRAIVEGASGDFVFYILNETGAFSYVSPSVELVLGYSQEEFKRSFDELLTMNSLNDLGREYVKKALRGEVTPVYELEILSKEGEIHMLEVSGLPRFSSAGLVLGVQGIIHDITESHKARQEIMRARDAAEAADRAKSNFLANISHELRTPLNALTVGTYLLNENELGAQQADYLREIKQATNKLQELITDILDFSKTQSGSDSLNPVEFVLGDLLAKIKESTILKSYEKGLAFRFEIMDELPAQLIGDHYRLNRVLQNLLDNAVKFTEKGEVGLRIGMVSLEKSKCRLHFEVIDTGIGMNKNEIDRLFDSFTQLDGSSTRKYGGLGLGLSVSKKMIELMGGEIEVESERGKGTTVSFDLDFRIVPGTKMLAVEQSAVEQLKEEGEEIDIASIDAVKLDAGLRKLARFLDLSDMMAEKQFEEIEAPLMLVDPVRTKKIAAKLNSYDFQGAKALLQNITDEVHMVFLGESDVDAKGKGEKCAFDERERKDYEVRYP